MHWNWLLIPVELFCTCLCLKAFRDRPLIDLAANTTENGTRTSFVRGEYNRATNMDYASQYPEYVAKHAIVSDHPERLVMVLCLLSHCYFRAFRGSGHLLRVGSGHGDPRVENLPTRLEPRYERPWFHFYFSPCCVHSKTRKHYK